MHIKSPDYLVGHFVKLKADRVGFKRDNSILKVLKDSIIFIESYKLFDLHHYEIFCVSSDCEKVSFYVSFYAQNTDEKVFEVIDV